MLSRLIKNSLEEGSWHIFVGTGLIGQFFRAPLDCTLLMQVCYRDWKNTCKLQVKLWAIAKEIFIFSSFISHIKGAAGLFPPTEMGTRNTSFPISQRASSALHLFAGKQKQSDPRVPSVQSMQNSILTTDEKASRKIGFNHCSSKLAVGSVVMDEAIIYQGTKSNRQESLFCQFTHRFRFHFCASQKTL